MQFPIQIEQSNGHYSAVLVGGPTIRVTAPSRAEVLVRMKNELVRRVQTGEIVWVDIPAPDPVEFVGILKDDPTLEDLREEIKRRRDADPYPEYE
ncbi:MAG TPA: hypothetical protein VKE40_01365 [Gemmataceae bacterium]|nr:hypothetical protein [Gemmataceae bacterium]